MTDKTEEVRARSIARNDCIALIRSEKGVVCWRCQNMLIGVHNASVRYLFFHCNKCGATTRVSRVIEKEKP